jgi:hypothetical protein
MKITSPTIFAIVGIVLLATVLSGCTSSASTSPEASVAASSITPTDTVPSVTPAASTAWVVGVTKTDTGYIVKGTSKEPNNHWKVNLKAGTSTFHIKLMDYLKGMSGTAYMLGSTSGTQVFQILPTDSNWGADMTVTETIPADGDYELTVNYGGNNWEADITQ